MSEEFFSISELNQFIKDVINAGFPQSLWICGEIQGFDRNRNKNHIFFELVEKDEESKNIIAKIGVVIFAGRKSHVEEILKKSENAFDLKDDIEVRLLCNIDFYPPHGAVRLVVESIDPVYTLGKIAQQKQKLISMLKKKGVLDQNKKLALPLVPLHIGLITADDSAAYNDFLSELQKSGFAFTVYLRNALMQGNRTEGDVCDAIEELIGIKALDAIVITRGGGSIADLSYFDSQGIAEKIAACPLPVLSGIGHEINITITDMAAHTYAKTPTAIAHLLINIVQDYINDIDVKMTRILEGVQHKMENEMQTLKSDALDLHKGTMQFLRTHNEKIIRMAEVIKRAPIVVLADYRKTLFAQEDVLKKAIQGRIANEQSTLGSYRKIIAIAHPVNTMKRGFSITRAHDGKIIKSILDAKPEEELSTEVIDGLIESKVKVLKREGNYVPSQIQ